MRALLPLLLLSAAATAAVEAPLGPFARPGVPVLLRSDRPVVVDLEGWTFRVDGTTPVFPPVLPCAVRVDGEEVLRLTERPERLKGVLPDAPPDLAGDAIPIDGVALASGAWRALDLFDAVIVTGPVRGDEPWFPCVAQWVLAGGSVAVADAARLFPDGTGLGAAAERIEDLPPPRIPAPSNVRPDVYALVEDVASMSPPFRAARWVVLGAALACVLQILFAVRGRMRARTLAAGLAAVALLGAAAGILRTRADFTPVGRGRIEISWAGGGAERVRTYLVYANAGPGALAPHAPDALPVLFGSNREAWWRGPGEEAPVGEGVVRIFLVEEVRRSPGPPPLPPGEPPRDLWKRERPLRGEVRAGATPLLPPEAVAAVPLLVAVRAVVQD
ncbi:MAG TPA: hypothetical protein VFY93_14250 [Planctomycetota bacterium]|nr:hypothetical protein [Planctomycetota bacterium]